MDFKSATTKNSDRKMNKETKDTKDKQLGTSGGELEV